MSNDVRQGHHGDQQEMGENYSHQHRITHQPQENTDRHFDRGRQNYRNETGTHYDQNNASGNYSNHRQKREGDKKKPKLKFPDRWFDYENVGEIIQGTRLITFKVPLKEDFFHNAQHLPDGQRFTPSKLIENMNDRGLRLGLVIDLTFTEKYYDPKDEFMSKGIQYKKIFVEGHVIPKEEVMQKFHDTVEAFLQRSEEDSLVGIHCTHGVNRTGYVVCRYMVERLGMKATEALQAYHNARGYPVERQNYVDDLKRRAGEIEEVEEMPAPNDDSQSNHGDQQERGGNSSHQQGRSHQSQENSGRHSDRGHPNYRNERGGHSNHQQRRGGYNQQNRSRGYHQNEEWRRGNQQNGYSVEQRGHFYDQGASGWHGNQHGEYYDENYGDGEYDYGQYGYGQNSYGQNSNGQNGYGQYGYNHRYDGNQWTGHHQHQQYNNYQSHGYNNRQHQSGANGNNQPRNRGGYRGRQNGYNSYRSNRSDDNNWRRGNNTSYNGQRDNGHASGNSRQEP